MTLYLDQDKEDLYTLNELIQILENIRDRKTDQLNFPKALLTICKEIENLGNNNEI